MNELRDALEEYLAIRRSLGFKLHTDARILRTFVVFAERDGSDHITVALVLRWIAQPSRAQAPRRAKCLSVVRCFARWWSATDPRTQVPPQDLLPLRMNLRRRPHAYDEDDVPRLLTEAARLPSRKGLRGLTFVTFLGVIAATGLRLSEALALDRGDVDLQKALLTIRRTKFGKDRVIPVHPTTRQALAEYAAERDRILRRFSGPAFFVAETGRRLTEWAARYAFARISQRIGLRRPVPHYGCGRGPRLHDLRHRFAVRTLVDWYRAGVNVDQEMPKLAAYLGHGSVASTYWYLEAVPELLLLATERLRSGSAGGPSS